jgi:hypothetical protein
MIFQPEIIRVIPPQHHSHLSYVNNGSTGGGGVFIREDTFDGVREGSSAASGFHRSIGLQSIQLNCQHFSFAVYCDTPLQQRTRKEAWNGV